MEELSFIGEDLVQILLDYFGQHVAGPRRELYEKVTGLQDLAVSSTRRSPACP